MKRKTKIKPLGTPRESRTKRGRTQRQIEAFGSPEQPTPQPQALAAYRKWLKESYEAEKAVIRSITGRLA